MERLTQRYKNSEEAYTEYFRSVNGLCEGKAIDKLADYEDMQEQGLIAQCTCKDCNKGDWSGCAEGTIYCMEHGAYFSWSDSCNKAERDNEQSE